MRRSISGPLVVITIGVLFLLNNFYPEVFQWNQLFHYWPFLLIGLGAVRLLEVLVDAGRGRALPASSMSGGGIVLLILFCLIFWAASRHAYRPWHRFPAWVISDNGVQIFGEEHEFDVSQSMPVNATDTRVMLDGLRGNIIIGGDENSSVTVTGHRTIRAYNNSRAEEANRRLKLELIRSGNDIVIRSAGNSPDRTDLRVAYDLDIKIPRRMSLAAQGATENITAEAIDGDVDISGGTGNVRLTSIGGYARIESTRRKDLIRAVGVKGNLDLRGTGQDLQIEDVTGQVSIQGSFFGTLDFRNLAKPLHFESDQTDLRVQKLPGTINMDLGDFRATGVVGPLRLRCQSRDIHVTDFSDELDVNVDRGDVELRPRTPLAKIDVHVRAGDIDLALPEKTKFDLHASTAQGEVGNEYGDGIEQISEGRSASGKSTNASGPRVTLTTDRGNITLKKL